MNILILFSPDARRTDGSFFNLHFLGSRDTFLYYVLGELFFPRLPQRRKTFHGNLSRSKRLSPK